MQEAPKQFIDEAPLPNAEIVEAITGVPLIPEGIGGISLAPESIRGFVHTAMTRIVRKHLRLRADTELALSPQQIEEVRSLPEICFLGAELRSANDTLYNWHNPPEMPSEADELDTPRSMVQARAFRNIIEHTQQAPLTSQTKKSPYRDGLLTVAPPGSGKTTLQALTVNYAGIGEPISDVLPQRRTALGIVYSQDLIRQYLNPDETLQRFINIGGRSIRVGAHYTHRRDGHDEYDLLLTTPESYEVAVRKGAVNPSTTVRNLLDEAHLVALAPQMQQHLGRFGSNLYLFTATPAIERGRRDLRKQYPHAHFGSMREFVHDGILSPVQLYTYRAGPEVHSETNIAIQQAAHLLESGRKTLIVCQPGEHQLQARSIAQRINELYAQGAIKPHPRFTHIEDGKIACAIGSNPTLNTEADIERIRQGERLVVTTVATGNQGLDIVDLDGLIIIGPQGAPWVVDQWLGRILRKSGRVAIAIEILPHTLRRGKPLASIYHSFDMDDKIMIAGQYIGMHSIDEAAALNYAKNDKLSAPTALGKLLLPSEIQSASTTPTESDASVALEPDSLLPVASGSGEAGNGKLPEDIEQLPYLPPTTLIAHLVEGISLREATIAPSDLAKRPPPEYKPLMIDLPEGIPIEWVYNILAKQEDPDIRYVGVWERDEEGEMQYVRYYSPASHRYLAEHPVPELVNSTELIDQQIADLLGVSRRRIRTLINNLKIKPVDKITKYRRTAKYYDTAAIAQLAEIINKIAHAEETDEPVVDIQEELGIENIYAYLARYGIVPAEKHRNPLWGKVGICAHIEETEATFLRKMRGSIRQADPKCHITCTEIAELADISLSGAFAKFRELSDEQAPLVEWMSTNGTAKLSMVTDRAWGEAFAEYLKPERVLPWEVTHGMVEKYFGRKVQVVHKKVDTTSSQISLKGLNIATIYPITIIQKLIDYGLEPIANAPSISVDLAALSAEHINDPERVAYSQSVQSHFIPPEHIPAVDDLAYYIQRRITPPQLPKASLTWTAAHTEPQPMTHATEPQSEATPVSLSSLQAVEHAEHKRQLGAWASKAVSNEPTKPILNIPEGYVNIGLYLRDQGLSCASNLIPLLARQNGINFKEWLATNQGPLTPTSDAELLALAILDAPIAPQNTGDPHKDWLPITHIAAEFSGRQTTLSEGDVHKVAVKILGQRPLGMEGLSTPFRIREADGMAGTLASHYVKHFADDVRKALKGLEARRELANIRRW